MVEHSSEPVEDLLVKVLETLLPLQLNAEIGRALAVCAMMDNSLSMGIQFKMVHLSSDITDRIFGGNGPLATFSAKIDVAYSLEIIDAEMRNQLHVIRRIRNEFAHSTDLVSFSTDSISKLCKKLTLSSKIQGNENAYIATINLYTSHIRDGMAKKLNLPVQPSSHEKSALEILRRRSVPGQTDKDN